MAKLALLFAIAAVFHATLAHPIEKQQQQILQAQQLVNQIRQTTSAAATDLQAIKVDSYQNRVLLTQQANEYTYYLQNVIYNLQQGIQNYQWQQVQQQGLQQLQQQQGQQQGQQLRQQQGQQQGQQSGQQQGQQLGQQQGQQQGLGQQYFQQWQYQQQLQQILNSLSQNSYSVQQAINGQTNQLVYLQQAIQQGTAQQINWQQSTFQQFNLQQLTSVQATQLVYVFQVNLHGVAAQAQQLAQLVLQYQKEQNYQYYINYEILGALGELLAAVQRVQVQNQVQTRTQQEYRDRIQSVSNQIATAIQNVNTEDQQTAQNLAQYAQQQAQIVGLIVNRLQRQNILNNQGDSDNVIQQVANKLSEIRTALEQAANYQGTTQAQVSQLRNQLRINASGTAAQIERLIEVGQTNQSNQERQQVSNLVRVVLGDALTAARNLQTQLQIASQNNHSPCILILIRPINPMFLCIKAN